MAGRICPSTGFPRLLSWMRRRVVVADIMRRKDSAIGSAATFSRTCTTNSFPSRSSLKTS